MTHANRRRHKTTNIIQTGVEKNEVLVEGIQKKVSLCNAGGGLGMDSKASNGLLRY